MTPAPHQPTTPTLPWERPKAPVLLGSINPKEHFERPVGPIEHEELEECPATPLNIGWTLGNDCPYRCTHCYSMSAREKGMNFSVEIVDRIVDQLVSIGVETVNLGGNEPLFTNGPNPRDTLLPYIIDRLVNVGILVGLTTSGITALHLERDHNKQWRRLNDLDVSFDSPFEDEHNANRGAKIFKQAIRSLELAQQYDLDHTMIMCGMNWNFTRRHLERMVEMALQYDAHIRINPIKPVEAAHMESLLSAEQYYDGFSYLMSRCSPVDLGEPPIAAVTDYQGAKGCPCGRTSFRIHSITPDGRIPVSPCVYLHDYKFGDLRVDDLADIVQSPQFKSFRRRNANPEAIPGCAGCDLIQQCRGGCAGRSYLHHAHETGERSLFARDPYCPKDIAPTQVFPQRPQVPTDKRLVHMDYLCTWIGKPQRG
ncbi:radical SAM/SPASM domain-containing protein [Salinispora sp. H7-4]|uniref:radical SAM/SPASM domain-containing protein n=1 Tax=Salinispora sp. H7-4 TaxID=2748321 RepID=UPI0015D3EB1A|nr:radical SAM protein [Salinispora sp. H7-4]NYT92307.1 radical SAM protein [Salinispora sp. H7-4]